MSGPTQDPAVLSWQIALAPRPARERVGRHWWRDLVFETWQDWHLTWEARREAVALGYSTEEREFAQEHPEPTLRAVMVGLSGGTIEPGRPLP